MATSLTAEQLAAMQGLFNTRLAEQEQQQRAQLRAEVENQAETMMAPRLAQAAEAQRVALQAAL